MNNVGLSIGMVAIGLGLASIGFNLNGNQANATPAAFNAGPVDPTIVWYGISGDLEFNLCSTYHRDGAFTLVRAWSNGLIEGRAVAVDFDQQCGCDGVVEYSGCTDTRGWFVISSPNEGLNARADINFDERVDAADLGLLVAAWGDAPRNDYPPSDCPLGLIP